MKITVQVTQKDIDNGVRCNFRFCPIARALARSGYSDPCVEGTLILFGVGEKLFEAHVPQSVYDKMWDFDTLRVMEPFTLELEAE